MPSSRIPSPARSQGVISTPRRDKPRRKTRSVSSPAKAMSIRLSTLMSDSFKLSPMPNRKSVLNDDTNIEIEPRCKSWWKRLGEDSREVMGVLESQDIAEIKNVADEFDVEVLSQEKRNYTLDLPESSDGESISSIVIPQRKLFTQKTNNTQKKFTQIMNTRDSQSKRKSHIEPEKDIIVPPKNLFNQPKPRNKPVFPSGLLNISANKTLNKTKEIPVPEVKGQVQTLFGNRPGTKRKNMFADFIVSDSEDDIPEIQPKIFGFKTNTEEKRRVSSTRGPHSPTSSIDLELDEWKQLPSSTLVGNQLEDTTPVKRARLSKLSEAKESETVSTLNKTKQSNKSINTKNKSKVSSNSKFNHVDTSGVQDVEMNEEPNLSSSRLTRNKSKSIREASLLKTNKSSALNNSKNTTLKDKSLANETKTNENDNQNTKEHVDDNNEDIQESAEQIQEEDEDNEDFTLEYDNDEEHNIENAENIASTNISKDKDNTLTQLNNEKSIMKEPQLLRKSLNESINKNTTLNKSTKQQDDINQDIIDGSTEAQPSNEGVQKIIIEKQTQNIKKLEVLENVENNGNMSKHNTTNKLNSTNKINKSLNEALNKSENISEKRLKNQSSIEVANAMETDNENKTKENIETNNTEESRENKSNSESDSKEVQDESQEESEQIESEQEKNETNDQNETEENDEMEDNNEMDVEDEEQNETLKDDENHSNHVQEDEDEQTSDDEQESESNEISANKTEEDQDDLNESEVQDDEEVTGEEEQNESCNVDKVENEEIEINGDEQNESEVEENEESENNDAEENTSEVEDNEDEQDDCDDENEEQNETVNQHNDDDDNDGNNEEIDNDNESQNATSHTGERGGNVQKLTSPEAILHEKIEQLDSSAAVRRNTSVRDTKSILVKNLNIRPSLAPARESTGFADGTGNSSADNSGWDSHRTTRKTLRQTFGKDFTLRKSLRALVMEKSAKRHTNFAEKGDVTEVDNTKVPQANSTEFPHFDSYEEPEPIQVEETVEESEEHEISKQTRQTTLELYLQKIKEENLERKRKMEEQVRNSIKTSPYNPFKVPRKPIRRIKPEKTKQKSTKTIAPMNMLPSEVLEDMKYKPPKRFQPNNASWITKRLYKFLETKLEPKYDYKARVRAEKLVETIYNFTKELKKYDIAPSHSVDLLKNEMARLDVVKTHFDFYEFFHGFMPREIRIKVVPDVVNKISLPKHGVFADIIR